MAAHIPKQIRTKNDPHALEQQAIADDEESSLLANQQAQVSLIYFRILDFINRMKKYFTSST